RRSASKKCSATYVESIGMDGAEHAPAGGRRIARQKYDFNRLSVGKVLINGQKTTDKGESHPFFQYLVNVGLLEYLVLLWPLLPKYTIGLIQVEECAR